MTFDLRSLGWDEPFASAYSRYAGDAHEPGRVARADRGVCTVLTADGPVRASLAGRLLGVVAADPTLLPCAGDWVALRRWPDDRTTIEAVLPRRTAIVRRIAGKAAVGQLLAANVDAVAAVEPIDPSPDLARIERLLTLAGESGGQAVVVLTKCDLAADPPAVAAQVASVAPGALVLAVSAERGDGLAALRPFVASGRTLALLGRSGAGKSTLVNALAGATVMTTQAIRRVDGKGRHTTTHRALIPIPGGGAVLDMPGLRAIGLLDAEDGLDQAFADVAALAAACRYADCAHGDEPGCSVRAALVAGDLAPRRWESWLRLRGEVRFERGRREARQAAVERDKLRRSRRDAKHRASP